MKAANVATARPIARGGAKRMSIEPAAARGLAVDSWASGADDLAADEIRYRMIEFLPRLRRFAHSLTHDPERCEDLVQETCARALARSDQWRPDTRLDSWMYRIAQNLWIDQLRAEKVRGEIIDIAAIGDIPGCDGRAVIESRWSLLDLRERIAQLPPDQQALLKLVCMDGLSYKQAAEALDSPTGTVMSRLARARLALHDAIDRSSGERR